MKNKNFVIILLLSGIIFLSIKLFNLSNKIKNYKIENNLYKDSLIIEKNKNNELYYKNILLLGDLNNLKKKNEELYKEIKKYKEKIIYLSNIGINISPKPDTFNKENITYYFNYDSLIIINFYKKRIFNKENFNEIEGFVNLYFNKLIIKNNAIIDTYVLLDTNKTNIIIEKNDINLSLYTGIIKNKDNYEIFVRSLHPDVKIVKLNGAIIDKNLFKQKRFGFGPSLGFVLINENNKLLLKPAIGITVNYNIIKF